MKQLIALSDNKEASKTSFICSSFNNKNTHFILSTNNNRHLCFDNKILTSSVQCTNNKYSAISSQNSPHFQFWQEIMAERLLLFLLHFWIFNWSITPKNSSLLLRSVIKKFFLDHEMAYQTDKRLNPKFI